MATGIAVAYDFFIGTVTNIIAAAVLDSKAPSLLDDCDPDKQKAEDSKDDYHGPGLTFSRIKNYPGPQVALNWWETACRQSDGETSKADKNNGQSQSSRNSSKKTSKEVIKCLLTNGPDTTIVEASKNGHIEIVKVLIQKGVDINTKDDYGYTSLGYAALKGHAEVVDLLLDNGADINAKNNWGGTALVQAVFFGHVDIAKILIDNGANTNVCIHGDSLVIYAAKNGYEDLVDHLLDNGATYNSVKSRNGGDKVESRFKKRRSKSRNGELKY